MRKLVATASALLALGLAPSGATALTARQLRTIHPEGLAPQRGIGPVRLEQPQATVTAALGPGRENGPPTTFEGETDTGFDYRVAGITIEVGYVNGVVAAVTTKSPAAILLGHPLSDGLRTFRRVLRHRTHWRIDSCHHRVFTALAPGGPGTGIEWRGGKVHLVMIDAGGVLDDCAVL